MMKSVRIARYAFAQLIGLAIVVLIFFVAIAPPLPSKDAQGGISAQASAYVPAKAEMLTLPAPTVQAVAFRQDQSDKGPCTIELSPKHTPQVYVSDNDMHGLAFAC